jgi:hypothetical protein
MLRLYDRLNGNGQGCHIVFRTRDGLCNWWDRGFWQGNWVNSWSNLYPRRYLWLLRRHLSSNLVCRQAEHSQDRATLLAAAVAEWLGCRVILFHCHIVPQQRPYLTLSPKKYLHHKLASDGLDCCWPAARLAAASLWGTTTTGCSPGKPKPKLRRASAATNASLDR